MNETDATYLVAGSHPDTLASGRPIAPGDTVAETDVDPKDPHDAELINNGTLLLSNTSSELDGLSAEELKERAAALGLEVEGTGQGGRVVRADLIAAINDMHSADADKSAAASETTLEKDN